LPHLVYSNDFFNFGNSFPQDSFDAHSHGHRSAGAALAGALQAHFDSVVVIRAYQFDITAVALQGGSDGLDYFFDLLFEAFFGASLAATAVFTHKKSPKIHFAAYYNNDTAEGHYFCSLNRYC
jgi:hypothetical protein